MRFSNRFRKVTGFLAKGSPRHLARKGTFLIAQGDWSQWLGRGPSSNHRKFMVTARHVVDTHGDMFAVAFRGSDLTPEVWHIRGDSWTFGDPTSRPESDLAIRPFDPPSDAAGFLGLPVGLGVHNLAEPIELGQPAFVVGLLAWEHRDLPWSPRPVVRSASIAALNEEGVRWGSGLDRTAPRVHLLDTRSRSGFSGSPCFVQFYLSDARTDSLPEIWRQIASFAGNDPDTMGTIRTVTHWLGLFVGYADDSGIGIVVPSDIVESLLPIS